MSWVRKTPPPSEVHECKPPMRQGTLVLEPDGALNDLWRCGDCKALWRIYFGEWLPATWWQRLRHRGDGHDTGYDLPDMRWEEGKES